MKIAIVDDERPARSELSFLITDILPEAEILEAAKLGCGFGAFLSTPDIGLAFPGHQPKRHGGNHPGRRHAENPPGGAGCFRHRLFGLCREGI